jgi:hypothetical protein
MVDTDSTVEPGAQATANEELACEQCGRSLRRGRGFVFKVNRATGAARIPAQAGETTKCIHCALRHRPMLRRSLSVALVVGTVLTILNQGDTLFAGEWNSALYWKIPLTFCVPFLVATFGAMTNVRR